MSDLVTDRVPDAIRMALDRALVLVETLDPGLVLRRDGEHFEVIDQAGTVLARFPRDWLREVDASAVVGRVLELLEDRPGDERTEVLESGSVGDFEIHDLPYDGEVAVRVGAHTYVLERSVCLR